MNTQRPKQQRSNANFALFPLPHSEFRIPTSGGLALRGIEADFGPEHAETFRRDLHADLRADYVLANPPFNDSDWFRKDHFATAYHALQRVE